MTAGDIALFIIVAVFLNLGLIWFSAPNKISFRWFVFINAGAAVLIFIKNDFLSYLFFAIIIIAMIISMFSGAWAAIVKSVTSTFRW